MTDWTKIQLDEMEFLRSVYGRNKIERIRNRCIMTELGTCDRTEETE
jgi:hypothetical protein